MMDQDDQPSLADDIFGTTEYKAPAPPERKLFAPWHRPRKQFVREYLWLEQIERMTKETAPSDGTLKYLGLPGDDLLDLRYFHDYFCAPREMKLRFLGFNTAAHPNTDSQIGLNISLAEVKKLGFVDPRSDVITDDVRKIANDASISWIRTLELAPYDVINLDLCDGFGIDDPSVAEPTHFDAVNSLVALQAKSKTPWLLLLTTRTGRDHVHADVLRKLLVAYSDNLEACPPFRDASNELFQLDVLPAVEDLGLNVVPVFVCGVCKWLLGLALNLNPPWKVEVRSSVGYRVVSDAAHEDLVSVAIRFSPIFSPVMDARGLARNQGATLDECSLAEKMIRRVAGRVDADAALRDDPALHDSMVEATAKLLSLARYDPVEYRRSDAAK